MGTVYGLRLTAYGLRLTAYGLRLFGVAHIHIRAIGIKAHARLPCSGSLSPSPMSARAHVRTPHVHTCTPHVHTPERRGCAPADAGRALAGESLLGRLQPP
eukprot:1823263-Rhodomonas_salina.2